MGPPTGYARLPQDGSSRTVTLPEGATRFDVPPLEVAAAVTVRGRVLDAAGGPVAGARVVGVCEGSRCVPLPGSETLTDATGVFRLPTGWDNTVPIGQAARLLIRLRDGSEHEVSAVPGADGAVTVKLPVQGVDPAGTRGQPAAAPEAKGPATVAPREVAGVVVDADGRPIEGVEVAAYSWIPRPPTTTTDGNGLFRLAKLPEDGEINIRLRKDGYETQYHDRPTGAPGWVAVLGNGTSFEGRVLAPDGSPVPDAPIRADAGPKRRRGYVQSETLTETRSDAGGRYRLFVVPDQYDIAVRVPGVGVARLAKEAIAADQHRTLDIPLAPGVEFAARVVDRETGKPVEGVRLWHWQRPGIEGTSDADGQVRIRDVPPGKYPRFQVEARGYTRWWSDACLSEWSRYQKVARHGFQRNFDGLDFDLQPGMGPVTIQLERGATVRGRVLDPDGKPVAGATVAPALTSSGNSLTGDTRFSVETDEDGRFEVLLPASGDVAYNLVAHDGKFRQWRTWANGVVPPFKTTPGQVIEGMEIRLTHPGTVTGRVVDARGNPVEGREVRAEPTARDENRYYDPTTKTGPDGTFALKFVRPGEHFIQVAPFWLDAGQAPEGTSRTVTVDAGEAVAGIELRAAPGR
jgi:protocatechuate 3,4-dioxygenase beta subunit